MLKDKEQASQMLALVGNPTSWEALKEWAVGKQLQTQLELEVAQSEQVMFRLQGRLGFLRELLALPEDTRAILKSKE